MSQLYPDREEQASLLHSVNITAPPVEQDKSSKQQTAIFALGALILLSCLGFTILMGDRLILTVRTRQYLTMYRMKDYVVGDSVISFLGLLFLVVLLKVSRLMM